MYNLTAVWQYLYYSTAVDWQYLYYKQYSCRLPLTDYFFLYVAGERILLLYGAQRVISERHVSTHTAKAVLAEQDC